MLADAKSAILQPPGRGLSARSLASAPPEKVTLASPARLTSALTTAPLRYQLFPGVGYFHSIRKKERLLLLSHLVRSENRFKSPLDFGANENSFWNMEGKYLGPAQPGRRTFCGVVSLQPSCSPTQSPLYSSPLDGGYPFAPLCRLLRKKSRLLRLLGCLCPLG